MSMSDPIADLLTRLRNAQMAKLPKIVCPSSKSKVAICRVLQDEGYIASFSVVEVDKKPVLTVDLKYYQGRPVIEEIKRERKGTYVYFYFKGPGAVIAELERAYRLEDSIIKFLTVKLEQEPAPPRGAPVVAPQGATVGGVQ